MLRWAPLKTAESVRWLSPLTYPHWLEGQDPWLETKLPYALKIMHPAYRNEGRNSIAVSWQEIARASGVSIAPGTNFFSFARQENGVWAWPPVFDRHPEEGGLPPELLGAVYEHLDNAEFGLVWTSWNYAEAFEGQSAIVDDESGQQFYAAVRQDGGPGARGVPFIESPMNYWWPKDNSWCAATGYDEVETIIAADSIELLRRIHEDPRLETIILKS